MLSQTNLQIITAAFRKIGVVADGKQPSPTQGVNGLEVLNDHLLSQQRDGWNLGWFPQSTSQLNSVAPLRDEDIGEIKLCLTYWLAPEYGVTLDDPLLVDQISEAFRMLNKRNLKFTDADLGELSRAQGGPWGGPNWL